MVFFCFFGWWTPFEFLRDRLWYIIDILGFLALFGPMLFDWTKWWPAEPKPTASQPGGPFYFAFIVAMLLWWTLSSYLAGTLAPGSFFSDHTLWTQYFLSAVSLVTVRPARSRMFWRIDLQPRKWIWSYLVFFGAILMMIADTDYQLRVATPPIKWELWIRWRCLNYGLIIPYLAAGIAVIHGWSLARICAVGVMSIPCLLVLLRLSGVPM